MVDLGLVPDLSSSSALALKKSPDSQRENAPASSLNYGQTQTSSGRTEEQQRNLEKLITTLKPGATNKDLIDALHKECGSDDTNAVDLHSRKKYGIPLFILYCDQGLVIKPLTNSNEPVREVEKNNAEIAKPSQPIKPETPPVEPPTEKVKPSQPIKPETPPAEVKASPPATEPEEQVKYKAGILRQNRQTPNLTVPAGTFDRAVTALGKGIIDKDTKEEISNETWLKDYAGFSNKDVRLLTGSDKEQNTCAVRLSRALRVLDPERMPTAIREEPGGKIRDKKGNYHVIAVSQAKNIIEKELGKPYYSGPITKEIPEELLGKRFIGVVEFDPSRYKSTCTGHVDLVDFSDPKNNNRGFVGYSIYDTKKEPKGKVSYYLIEEDAPFNHLIAKN